jgi:hypothetical protein
VRDFDIDGEVVAEEDGSGAGGEQPTRVLEHYRESALPILGNGEVRSAAIAAAGGVLAGAVTVAAVRAVTAVGSRRTPRRIARRRGERPGNIVASRSFLVDVHLLGR